MKNNTCLTASQFDAVTDSANKLPSDLVELINTYESEFPSRNYVTRNKFLRKVYGRRVTKKESEDFLMAQMALNILKKAKVD